MARVFGEKEYWRRMDMLNGIRDELAPGVYADEKRLGSSMWVDLQVRGGGLELRVIELRGQRERQRVHRLFEWEELSAADQAWKGEFRPRVNAALASYYERKKKLEGKR